MNLVFFPPWSTRVVASVAFGLLLLAVVRFWRESGRKRTQGLENADSTGHSLRSLRSFAANGFFPFILRLAILGLLVFVMLNPESLLPRKRTGKPKLAVLLDTSSSMATRDSGANS